MKVYVFNTLENADTFEVEATTLKEVLNYIKYIKGEEYLDNILNNLYKFALCKEGKEPVILIPEILSTSFSKEDYDTIIILKDIEGSELITAVMIASATGLAAGGTTAAVIAFVANMLIVSAISMAVSAIMSALSPTASFGLNPNDSQTRTSSLFNNAPLVKEQGGIVPLCFGECYVGGVLLGSSVTTEEILKNG